MTAIETINGAVLMLAGRCDGARQRDGAGFNRYDAQWGHDAARKIEAGYAPNAYHALKILAKYRGQLSAAGIILPTLAVVPAPAPAPKVGEENGVRLASVGDSIQIRFPYDPAKVEIARGLPGRRWDAGSKAWCVPASSLDAVFAAFPGARPTAELAAEIQAKRDAEDAAERALSAQLAADLAAYESIRPAGLYEHQDAGIRWLIEQRQAILADDMGLGKTRQALLAAKALGDKIIVVAPAGLRINWLREAAAVDAQIEIFSWAKVPDAPDCEFTLIADEAHYAQSLKAARTKRILALAKAAKAVYLLSGTPIKNGRPANLFPLLVAVGHRLAKDRRHFDLHFCAAHATRWTQWDVTGSAHLDELHRELADVVLRRMTDEVLDLPELTRVIEKAELSDEAQSLYNTKLHEMQAEYRRRKLAGEIKDGGDALVLLNQLRHAGSLAKVEYAVEKAEEVIEQGGQVVLFTAFLDSAKQIGDALNAGRITGDENAEQRQAAIDAFQAGTIRAMVCTLGAGNVGITLTAGRCVILVDRPWTPGDAQQAEKRCHRIGTTGTVLSVWLQANGADEAIDALLQDKQERIELVLAGKRKRLEIRTLADVAEAVLG